MTSCSLVDSCWNFGEHTPSSGLGGSRLYLRNIDKQTLYDVTQHKASVNICCCEKIESNTMILSATYILFNQRHPTVFQFSQ